MKLESSKKDSGAGTKNPAFHTPSAHGLDGASCAHVPMSEYAHSVSENRLVFRLRSVKGVLNSCTLYYGDRACRQNQVIFTSVDMCIVACDLMFDWWEAEFDTPYKRICYYFELSDGWKKTFYCADLFLDCLPLERFEYFEFPFIHRADIANIPDWAKDAVIYNIFPDSFATGKRFISLEATKKEWHGEITRGKLGGTFNGITENAGYLKELGVNCVYINPVFAAGEYHKYDLIDYYNADPCFGTNDDFGNMVNILHKNGIRVIVDGVFNHCGWHFFAFDDVVKNGKASKYADWFYRLEYPVIRPENEEDIPGYECFAYERRMPKMNTTNPEVVAYFCDVCRYWLREYNIDGWRLDVADEVNDSFWRSFRAAAVEANPGALLIGEIWGDARHWMDGSMFNSSMNYDFHKHCRDFFAKSVINAEEFNTRVVNMLMRYRKNLLYAQLNILDSHDTARFLTVCGGDKRRLKLAVMFQMCFVGIPSIFYGDEQGIEGLTESEYRKPMTWNGDRDLLEFYQKVIKLRNNNIPLRRGGFKTLTAQGSLFAFTREYNGEEMTIALNAGEEAMKFDGQTIEPFGYFIIQPNLPIQATGY